MKTIQDVIDQLDGIVNQCAASQNKAGYFAALYKRMTMAVADGIKDNAFADGERMEKLDVLFARRYIEAFNAYHSGRSCTKAWKLAFDHCNNNKLIVLQHILLGVNTHINLDLAIAASQTCTAREMALLEDDFNRINAVIQQLSGNVQAGLTSIWWPMKFLTNIAKGREEVLLNFSIEKARRASWGNALWLANMQEAGRGKFINTIDDLVCGISAGITNRGQVSGYLLKLIRATEHNNVAANIRFIESTKIN